MKVPRGSARQLVLASGSPRRHELLALTGLGFEVVVPDVDEAWFEGERPEPYVERVARAKAEAVVARLGAAGADVVVIAADTTVELDGVPLGKPDDDAHARAMLTSLSGRSHRVHTAVVVATTRSDDLSPSTVEARVVTTDVDVDELTPDLIDWYVATGEPADKAGAYAIQGLGALLVRSVSGSVSNVVGLPMVELRELLTAAGIPATGVRPSS